jgi:hypothetical protein
MAISQAYGCKNGLQSPRVKQNHRRPADGAWKKGAPAAFCRSDERDRPQPGRIGNDQATLISEINF